MTSCMDEFVVSFLMSETCFLDDKKSSVCCHGSSSVKPAQVGADYPQANDRTIFWPMLAHTADRQQLGSSPGFTFQEVGVCVVPMNQEETRSLEIFDIVYSSGLSYLGVPGVPCFLNLRFFSRTIFNCSKLRNIDESNS